jgi:hypothetical protein
MVQSVQEVSSGGFQVVGTGVAVMVLTAAALVWHFFGYGKWTTKLLMILAAFASSNLTGGWFGNTARWITDKLFAFTTWATRGAFGEAVPAVVGLVVVFVVAVGLGAGIVKRFPAAPPKYAVHAAFLLPLVLTVSQLGPVGQVARAGLTAANKATAGAVGSAFADTQSYQKDADTDRNAGHGQSPQGGHR